MNDYRDELYHHGVKGMKWGVRRNRDRAAKVGRRIERHQVKLDKASAKKGKENFLYRNTMGDYRRGEIARLKNVKTHREAKADYKENKTKENKQKLSNARVNRVARNTAGKAIAGRGGRGAYHRYRDSGDSAAKATLKAYGKMAVTGLAVGAGVGIATKIIQNNQGVKAFNDNGGIYYGKRKDAMKLGYNYIFG